MISLPIPFGSKTITAWRLDQVKHKASWNSGIGAAIAGGRWNPANFNMVYCSLDPSTAILEVAVHKGFQTLDAIPHILTQIEIVDLDAIHIVQSEDVPNPAWLIPGTVSAAQQEFGRALALAHRFVAIPSTVSRYSWNLIFRPDTAAGAYTVKSQERFSLDPRLNPAAQVEAPLGQQP